MSGTSLDGVDIAYCEFSFTGKKWNFSLRASQTVRYSSPWKKNLSSAHQLSSEELFRLHSHYGKYLGVLVNWFIEQNKIAEVDFISSHGHTIFHQPEKRFTFQLGDGNALHAETGIPVIYNFRSLDVQLGGEGAPLVPIGDRLLFSSYDVCLNLGGIANLSLEKNGERMAFDICFCNMALNYLATRIGKEFDKNGKMASRGKVNIKLLQKINSIYSTMRNKRPSLAREGFEKDFVTLLKNQSISINDRLATVCESVAHEILLSLSDQKITMLVTGGGALNNYLIKRISSALPQGSKIIVPEKAIINFKEAIVFGFLGVLRMRNEINALKSVTGAKKASCSGTLIG